MPYPVSIKDQVKNELRELSVNLTALNNTTNLLNRSRILEHIRLQLANLIRLNEIRDRSPVITKPLESTLRTMTLRELSQYDGKDGRKAYVAVNGTIYDVTGSAAWAAASHFGLLAGNDLTNQYASCHGSPQILLKLPVVGRLNNGG